MTGKKSGWYAGLFLLAAMVARAGVIIYNQAIVNNPALAYNNTYVVNLGSSSLNGVSAQAVYSSATIANVTFQDGSQSTGTFTILNYAALSTVTVRLNGVAFTYGYNWPQAASAGAAATTLATAINASSLSSKLSAQAIGSVVTATSTLNGSTYNYPMQTSNAAVVSVSAANMAAGTSPAFTLGSGVFTSPTPNGLGLALPVLYAQGTNAIGGLTDKTTYYAIPALAGGNTFQLAKYSTSAVAGSPSSDIVVVTSTNTGLVGSESTYTLSALPITGTPGLVWSVSNDGVNWNNLNVSSVTVGSYTSGGAASIWAFGYIGTQYLRLSVTAPTTGAINLVTRVVGTN